MKVFCLMVLVCALMAVAEAVSIRGILAQSVVAQKKGKAKGLKQKTGEKTAKGAKLKVKEALVQNMDVAKPVDVSNLRSDGAAVSGAGTTEVVAIAKRQDSFNTALHLSFTVITMVLSRIIYKLDYKDPKLVLYCRVAFCSYIVLSQVLFWLLRQMILRNDDRTLLPASASASPMQALAGLMGTNSGGGGLAGAMLGSILGTGAGGAGALTVKDYDLAQVQKLSSGMLFELLVASYMHLVVKNTAKLLMVPLMGLSGKLRAPIVQIHLLRLRPVGQLARPFKSGFESMLAGLQKGQGHGGQGQVTGARKADAASVAAPLPEASIASQRTVPKTSGQQSARSAGSASGSGKPDSDLAEEVIDLDEDSDDVSPADGASEQEKVQRRESSEPDLVQGDGQGFDSAELLDAIDRLGELELD